MRGIEGTFRVGLEDPALTGIVFAVIGPVNALLNLHPGYSVNLRPCFEGEDVIEGNLAGSVKFQPVRLIFPALRFGLSPEIRKAGKSFIGRRWKRKR